MYQSQKLAKETCPEIGRIIREAREKAGWNQRRLSAASGVPLYCISPIEAHGKIDHFSRIQELCDVLGVDSWPLMVLASRKGLLFISGSTRSYINYLARIAALEELLTEQREMTINEIADEFAQYGALEIPATQIAEMVRRLKGATE